VQDAPDAVVDGDTVLVAPGIFLVPILSPGDSTSPKLVWCPQGEQWPVI